MPRPLYKEFVFSRDDLIALSEARLREAEVLVRNEEYAGAVYLAGFAVECCFKAAVCTSLDWNELRGGFKTHDLEGLLVYSGFDRRFRMNKHLVKSLASIIRDWKNGDVRYNPPMSFDRKRAHDFLEWVNDPELGVIPWFRSQIG